MTSVTNYTPSQMATIKRTVASDTNDLEFDLFMEAARSYGLDPFRKQISAVVFSKDKADKRKMSIIVGRDGLRSIAQRCGDYRPASGPAEFDTDPDLKGPENPHGIVRCAVTVFKQDKSGEWFPVYGEAYWDEFAPVKEQWAWDEEERKRKPTGKMAVDGQWSKMPRLMIQKCAEAQALRAGWPDTFSGLYAEEEIDQAKAKDITPSESLAEEAQTRRANALGGRGVLMAMDATGVLERVPMGKVADRCMEFINANSPEDVHAWDIRNREALREFWSEKPSDALEVKRVIEAKTKALVSTS